MIYFLITVFALLLFIVVFFRLYLHLIPKNKLTILMYHSVLPTSQNPLEVTVDELDQQMKYLSEQNYTTLFFKDLDQTLPRKSIILTFDDGYKNNQEYLIPLLQRYGMKAVIFLPTKLLGKGDKMSFEDLRNLDSSLVEFALHGHEHMNYEKNPSEKVGEDLKQNIQTLQNENIPFENVLAYPYGRYKKNDTDFYKIMKDLGITHALRIGNKLNYFPTKNRYELCRIGIDGGDSLGTFKLKLFFGKLKF